MSFTSSAYCFISFRIKTNTMMRYWFHSVCLHLNYALIQWTQLTISYITVSSFFFRIFFSSLYLNTLLQSYKYIWDVEWKNVFKLQNINKLQISYVCSWYNKQKILLFNLTPEIIFIVLYSIHFVQCSFQQRP